MSSLTVQGVLIEKPNSDLVKWIMAIIVTHAMFCAFTAFTYMTHDVADYRWTGLLASWAIFGLIIPMIGIGASKKTEKTRLSLFSGVQAFLGFCNLINFLSFSSLLITVINWCVSDECLAQFDTRNKTCVVQLADKKYEMAQSYCQDIPQNIGTALFFALLSLTSFMGAIHARKMNQIEIVDVVMVERTRVGAPPVVGIPEDVQVDITTE